MSPTAVTPRYSLTRLPTPPDTLAEELRAGLTADEHRGRSGRPGHVVQQIRPDAARIDPIDFARGQSIPFEGHAGQPALARTSGP